MLSLLLGMSSLANAKNVKIDVVTGPDDCPTLAEPDDPCATGEDVCFTQGAAHKITWKYKSAGGGKPDFRIVMKRTADSDIFASGCKAAGRTSAAESNRRLRPGTTPTA